MFQNAAIRTIKFSSKRAQPLIVARLKSKPSFQAEDLQPAQIHVNCLLQE